MVLLRSNARPARPITCAKNEFRYIFALSLIIHSLATYLYHTHNIMNGTQTFIALHMIRSSTRALAVDSIKRLYAVLLNRYFRVFCVCKYATLCVQRILLLSLMECAVSLYIFRKN